MCVYVCVFLKKLEHLQKELWYCSEKILLHLYVHLQKKCQSVLTSCTLYSSLTQQSPECFAILNTKA